jgi:pantothenate kinase type III
MPKTSRTRRITVLLAALVVAALPRLGWLAVAAAAVGALAGPRPGLAVLVVAAAAPVPLLAARDGEAIVSVRDRGIGISAEALFQRAARLPRVEIKRPVRVVGSSTVGSIQSGLYYGYAGLVDGILRRMIEELGRRPRVVATGGLAPLIATASEFIDEVDLTLTLDGLRLVYERVRGASDESRRGEGSVAPDED